MQGVIRMDSRNGQNGGYPPEGWQPPQGGYYYQPCRSEQKNAFATAAMVLGIISLLSLVSVYWALPIGALAILFTILSKRKGRRMTTHALIGLSTSLTSIIISAFILITTITFFVQALNPKNRNYVNKLFQSTYGYDFDEYMENYLEEIEKLYGGDVSDKLGQLFGIEP